jgi:hypothetical protein
MKTFLLLFYVISSSTFAAEPIELEKLIKGQDFKAECGCGVMNDKKETFVMSGMPEFAPAIVKFDGKVKELKFISSTEKNAPRKPGSTFTRTYGADKTKLKMDFKISVLCAPDFKGCKEDEYVVNTLIEDNERKTELKKLKGHCGC